MQRGRVDACVVEIVDNCRRPHIVRSIPCARCCGVCVARCFRSILL